MIMIGLLGSLRNREAFAYEAQNHHGFCIADDMSVLSELRKQGIERCVVFSLDHADLETVRAQGVLVFTGTCEGCYVGDYVFISNPGDCDYQARVSDILWAITNEKEADGKKET
ncbi:MAG: hypothetical protein AB2747_05295 [Candidatus Thiodiazotropha taylori]